MASADRVATFSSRHSSVGLRMFALNASRMWRGGSGSLGVAMEGSSGEGIGLVASRVDGGERDRRSFAREGRVAYEGWAM